MIAAARVAGEADLGRPRRAFGFVASILLHASFAALVALAPAGRGDDLDAVEMSVERHRRSPPPPPPEPEPEPEPDPEPPPRPRIAKAQAPQPPAPEPPPEAPPPPQLPPAAPVFDMSGASFSEGGIAWGGLQPGQGNTRFGKIGKAAAHTRPERAAGVPGGNGTGPATSAPSRITRRPVVEFEAQAVYPEQARRERVDGVVTLLVEILPSGRVGNVRIKPGTDPGYGLGRAAADAMRRFRFAPALDQDRRAVAHRIEYRFRFELPD